MRASGPSSPSSPSEAPGPAAGTRRRLVTLALCTLLEPAVLFVAGAIVVLGRVYGPLGWVAMLAVAGGAGGSIMLAAVLMGLAFLSSGSGHDESVDDLE